MASGSEQVSALRPEEVKFWQSLRQADESFYPEEICSVTVDDDFTVERHRKLDEQCDKDAQRITAIAEVMGVVVEEWPSHVLRFIRRDGLYNHRHDDTEEVQSLSGMSLGKFVMEETFASVPVEGQIDGGTMGMSLTLRAAGKCCVVLSSENNLWYPEFEEIIDDEGNVEDGEQISAGGYSFKISLCLAELVASEVVEDDLGVGEAGGE